jgi:hypothetical protein
MFLYTESDDKSATTKLTHNQVIEFIKVHNEYFDTNYKSVKEFNNNEQYRNIKQIDMINKGENKRLDKVEHVWHNDSDRWIYIERWSDGFIGVNCMQGDCYMSFRDNYANIDYKMSEFLEAMKEDLKYYYDTLSEIEFIDKVMWIYFEAIRNH